MAKKTEKKIPVPVEKSESKAKDESDARKKKEDLLFVVGIGASAGGLEAFQALLPNLPKGSNIAYVIVQHLDPSHPTMLVSLLSRSTTMEVQEIKDRTQLEPDHIYLAPPDHNVTLSGDMLLLSKPAYSKGPRLSIDLFFTSLAEYMGEKAVGIILSGKGSDGAHGVRAIKAFGGITIVQDEKTARYADMPRAAIDTGHVDLVLPPERIGSELLSVTKYPHPGSGISTEEDRTSDSIDRIFDMVSCRTGCDFGEYKINTINRRIGRRMAINRYADLQEYIYYMQHKPEEIDLLVKDILISVTRFFRDKAAFRTLSGYLPRIFKNKKKGDSIRVWVPGCSTGEEVYSLAILLSEALGEEAGKYTVQIFGTDLDVEAIEIARKGVYPEATVFKADKEILEKYFIRKDNMVQINDRVREMIVFAKHDLIKDPPFANLDLISCRNLLIYFNQSLQNRVVPLFHYVLNAGGLLFLGISESINQYSDLFSPLSKKWRIFERRDVVRKPDVMPKFKHLRNFRYKSPGVIQKSEKNLKSVMNDAVLTAFGPPAVMIDDRLQVVYFRGDTSPFLRSPEGEVNLDILHMARDSVRLDLRALVHRCSREGAAVVSRPLKAEIDGEEISMVIHVDPVDIAEAPEGALLVSFETLREYHSSKRELPVPENVDPRMFELENELVETRERLQTTIEELETTNEEMMSANEELQSANEELQSTNEELETTTEELQSTNEELNTVNDELQIKSSELSEANADLENILSQVGLPLVIVDRELRVKRYNLAATEIFSLTADDIGQVITSVGNRLSLTGLRKKLKEVITRNRTLEEYIEEGLRFMYLRIHPLRNKVGEPDGAMLIFVDKSKLMQTQRELKTVADISGIFLASENLEEIYQKLPELISSRFKFPYVTVELHDEKTNEIEVVGASGMPLTGKSCRTTMDKTICGEVMRLGAPILITGGLMKEAFRHPVLDKIGLKTILCMPLRLKDRILGTMVLADELDRPDITEIRPTLEVIAHHLALEIERVYKTAEVKQARDELESRVEKRTAELSKTNMELKREIADRKRTEKALTESENEKSMILDNANEMIVYYDENNNLIWANRAYLDVTGLPLPELKGKKCFTCWGVKKLCTDCPVTKAIETGEPQNAVMSPQNQAHWPLDKGIWDVMSAPVRNSKGNIIGAIEIARDITEQKKTEESLLKIQEEKELLADLVNKSSQPFAFGYPDGRLGLHNRAFEELTGYTGEELSRINWSEVMTPPEWIQHEKEKLEELARTGMPVRYEKEYIRKDGTRVPLEMLVHLARDEKGEPLHYYAFITDITKHKEDQARIESSLEEKEVLLKEVHHRVKNNMQIISSLVSLQADRPENSTIRNELRNVSHRVRSMAMIHEKLYQSTDLANIDFERYTENLLKYLWNSYENISGKIRLVKHLEPVSLPVDKAVPLGLILNELTNNALKHAFTGNGHGEVAVELKKKGQNGMSLVVRDNGSGLPEGLKWDQTDSLGLNLVKMLANQIHALTEVSSQKGTEFKLILEETAL